MKNFKKHFFILALCISIVIAVPLILKGGSGIPSAAQDTTTTAPADTTKKPKTETHTAAFTQASADYFNDALFIGDSRTVGLSEYGKLPNASYFANVGMSVYNLWKTTVSIPSVGKVQLEDLLSKKRYGKIYVMLGINELGYDFDQTVEKYGSMINRLKQLQPDAIVYIEANLHVSKSRSDAEKIITNANIDRFNTAIQAFADSKTVFYLDINTKFDDETGNLDTQFSADGVHPFAKYYAEWGSWLCTVAIQK